MGAFLLLFLLTFLGVVEWWITIAVIAAFCTWWLVDNSIHKWRLENDDNYEPPLPFEKDREMILDYVLRTHYSRALEHRARTEDPDAKYDFGPSPEKIERSVIGYLVHKHELDARQFYDNQRQTEARANAFNAWYAENRDKIEIELAGGDPDPRFEEWYAKNKDKPNFGFPIDSSDNH
jgi:hypothetical protein